MKKVSVLVLGMLLGFLPVFSTAHSESSSVDLPHPKGVTVHLEFPNGEVTEYVTETVEGVEVYVLQHRYVPPNTYADAIADITIPDGELSFILTRSSDISFSPRYQITNNPFSMNSSNYYRVQYDYGYLFFTIRGAQPQDLDGDGVMDNVDACLGSAIVSPFTNLEVDAFGCTPHQNIDKILELYGQLDLDGYKLLPGDPANGPKVNTMDFFTSAVWGRVENGHTITSFDGTDVKVFTTKIVGGIVCSEYQLGILKWLDLMRLSDTKIDPSSDRTYGDLFNGVNYGPISSYGGAHLAVVIYPTQSDWPNTYGWTTNGTVLDPWYIQEGTSYSSIAWILFNPFAAPYQLSEIPGYPITGGSYALSEADQAEMRQRRAEYIKNRKHNGYTHCKVDIRITNTQTGNRLGIFEGQFLREIPDSDLIFIPVGGDDNDRVWGYSLPEGNYTLEIVGKSDDNFYLMTEYNEQGIFDYKTNFTQSGGVSTKDVVQGNGATPLILPDGSKVYPVRWKTNMSWMPLLLD